MSELCFKLQFDYWTDALDQATWDEELYGDYRKVYICDICNAYHTSREKVNTDVPLLKR